MSAEPALRQPASSDAGCCCPYFHQAIELIGKRWSGAIVFVLLDTGPRRFSEIAHAIPQLSDRLLSQRIKELEEHGLVARSVSDDRPVRVTYSLTPMGLELGPALIGIKSWARQWLEPATAAVARRAPSSRSEPGVAPDASARADALHTRPHAR